MGESHLFVVTRETQWRTVLFFKIIRLFMQKTPRLLLGVRSFPGWLLHMQKTPDVLRARGTLFWPKIARELTKSDGTRTIRSEIARGIVSNRSQGQEIDKMWVFDPRFNSKTKKLKFRKFGSRTNGTPPFSLLQGGFSVRLFAWS